ncbi:MAG TPA: hypothetical protein VF572_06515 [Candidatus Saccharimonadales bacterium]|jgi:hypothetical protein
MKKTYIGVFVALLVIYIILAFALPGDPGVLKKYGLSTVGSRLLNLTIVLPIAAIYLAGLYSFIRIRDYADKISKTKEGPAFDTLAKGVMVLAYSLPINSIISSYASYVRHANPGLLPEITVVRQYLALILAFTAIVLIARGVRGLYDTLGARTVRGQSFLDLVGPVVLASVYTWLVVSHYNSEPGTAPYYLPIGLVILTIAIPYIYAWCVGARAALQLRRYREGVKGSIYKRSINNIAKGIAVVIVISIMLQVLTTLSGLLNRLELTPLLAVIYVLIAFYVVGYGLIARGAKQLRLIEEA